MIKKMYQSKKGAAAFYIVIFTMLLLSVITMSFIRIILSEATKSTNDDLSKSAYDSALAGVEDAKIALVKYHQCLDAGYTGDRNGGNVCQRIIWYMRNGGCDTVALALSRNGSGNGGEVIVKEGTISANSEDMLQAYTCVKISEDLDDYRSQVSDNHRVRLIPIRTSDINKVTGIEFKWSPSINNKTGASNSLLPVSTYNANNSYPVVGLDFYQTDPNFTLGELSVNNDTVGTDHVSLLFQPQKTSGITKVSKDDALGQSDKADNAPIRANCNNSGEFQCQTMVQLPSPFHGGNRSESTSLLRVELPYGEESVDFAIRLCAGTNLDHLCDETLPFIGVQAQIDSTGRANDLFRRVDARVELIDTNFPYPEFAIQLTGSDDKSISKSFWVTRNCWTTNDSQGAYDGATYTCDDSGNI